MSSFIQGPHFPELMIDIETLSTRYDAAIISIAAVRFNITTKQYARPFFYEEIDHESLTNFHVNPKTIKWWEQQDKTPPNGSTKIQSALVKLIDFINEHPPTRVWAKSPSFDINRLEYACDHFDLEWPIPFWKGRDVRTAMDMGNIPNNFTATHNAVEDCFSQIRSVIESFDNILLK